MLTVYPLGTFFDVKKFHTTKIIEKETYKISPTTRFEFIKSVIDFCPAHAFPLKTGKKSVFGCYKIIMVYMYLYNQTNVIEPANFLK